MTFVVQSHVVLKRSPQIKLVINARILSRLFVNLSMAEVAKGYSAYLLSRNGTCLFLS